MLPSPQKIYFHEMEATFQANMEWITKEGCILWAAVLVPMETLLCGQENWRKGLFLKKRAGLMQDSCTVLQQ